MGRAQAAVGKMAYQSLRLEYLQIPPVSRAYTTACVLTTAAVVSRCSAGFSLCGLDVIGSWGKRVWASGKPRWFGLRVGGGGQGSTLGLGIAFRLISQGPGRECYCRRVGGGSGLQVSF